MRYTAYIAMVHLCNWNACFHWWKHVQDKRLVTRLSESDSEPEAVSQMPSQSVRWSWSCYVFTLTFCHVWYVCFFLQWHFYTVYHTLALHWLYSSVHIHSSARKVSSRL